MGNEGFTQKDWSRRCFLQTMGAGLPTLRLMFEGTGAAAGQTTGSGPKFDQAKFTPVDLSRHFNSSPSGFGPREQARGLSGDSAKDGLLHTPAGAQSFRGIPFLLGPEGVENKCWIVLSSRASSSATPDIEIPLGQRANFVCLTAFCDWDKNETPPPGEDVAEQVGQRLAEVALVYEDGNERVFPLRRRFEVGAPSIPWGHLCYAAEPHTRHAPRKLTDPLPTGFEWGRQQMADFDNNYPDGPDGRPLAIVWVTALANPIPEKPLQALRFRATSEDPLIVCALTLFRGHENPLRYERLSVYRITLPEAAAEETERWKVSVDLGIAARTYPLADFEPDAWLTAPGAGLGERCKPVHAGRYLLAEVTASPRCHAHPDRRQDGTGV